MWVSEWIMSSSKRFRSCWFFFFQAEDGIRDLTVTGVQTCALPIWVQEWMGFPAGQASITSLPTNFWSRFISAGATPGRLAGLLGLAGLLAVCWAAAVALFGRQDISG